MNLPEREYPFSESNFQFLKMKVKQLAGINLADTKNELVYSRISRLVRLHHFNNFDDYCAHLNQNDPLMEREFVNAITTNFTSFMRENHHFDYLREKILPELLIRNSLNKRLRIWSAGCSTGEEAYSISFIVNDCLMNQSNWDAKILATDIDSDALNKAKSGIYPFDVVDDISTPYRLNKFCYFSLENPKERIYKVNDDYKKMVHFKQFNLMSKEAWPMSGPFDVIFCRNVMIYFERAAQHQVIKSLTNLLADNGFLILGHSESVPSMMQNQLKFIDRTIYRRIR